MMKRITLRFLNLILIFTFLPLRPDFIEIFRADQFYPQNFIEIKALQNIYDTFMPQFK